MQVSKRIAAMARAVVLRSILALPILAVSILGVSALAVLTPATGYAQAESPYSLAIGTEKTTQKDEGFVGSVSDDLITTLRGKRGESLAIASTAFALVSFFAGLKAGAIVFGIMGVLFLALSHPYIALLLAIVFLAVHRYRNRDYDQEFEAKPKAADAKTPPVINVVIQGGTTTATTATTAATPKINRPM